MARTWSPTTYEHFHAPFNENNRFVSSATDADKHFLRDFDRVPPYKTHVNASVPGASRSSLFRYSATSTPTVAPQKARCIHLRLMSMADGNLMQSLRILAASSNAVLIVIVVPRL